MKLFWKTSFYSAEQSISHLMFSKPSTASLGLDGLVPSHVTSKGCRVTFFILVRLTARRVQKTPGSPSSCIIEAFFRLFEITSVFFCTSKRPCVVIWVLKLTWFATSCICMPSTSCCNRCCVQFPSRKYLTCWFTAHSFVIGNLSTNYTNPICLDIMTDDCDDIGGDSCLWMTILAFVLEHIQF